MRNEKKIEVNGKEMIIKEKPIKEYRKFVESFFGGFEDLKEKPWFEQYERLFCKFFDVAYEGFEDLTPSEIKYIVLTWKEVNADLLAIPDWMELIGLGEIVRHIQTSIKQNVEGFVKKYFQKLATLQSQSQEVPLQENKSNTTPINSEMTSQVQQPQMQN